MRVALDSLRRVVRALRLSASEAERTLGISVAQLFVLQQLAGGPRSIGQLAAETLTDPSSVSVVARRLVEHGLVSRKAARDDARRAELTLTGAGKRVLARAPQAAQSRLVEAIAQLPDRRRRELACGLADVARAIGAGDATLFFEDDPANPKRTRRARS